MTRGAAMATSGAAPAAANPRRFFSAARETIGRFWLEHLMMWSLEHCPWVARATKPFFLASGWICAPRLRAMTIHNARIILGDDAGLRAHRRLAKAMISNSYDFIISLSRASRLSLDSLLEEIESVEGVEHFRAARQLGRGLIIATAHLGDFECGMAALHRIEPRVHVAFHRDRMPVFERLRSVQRQRLGVIEAPVDGGPGAWLAVRDALLANEVVLVQADRALPGQKGMLVPFLHSRVMFASGPARLSILTRAAIVPAFAVRNARGRVRVILEPAIVPEAFGDDVKAMVAALAAVIGRFVGQYPQQYHGVHDDWLRAQQAIDSHEA